MTTTVTATGKTAATFRLVRHVLVGVAIVGVTLGAAFAQESAERSVTVDGTGTVYAAPQIARVDLGVSVLNDDPGAAVEAANEQMRAVIDALVDLGIERADLQTTNFNLFREERYDGSGSRPSSSSYRVDNTLRVTVRDTEQVGAVLSRAIEAGANAVNALNYTFADAAALEEEARALAVEDARAKAEQLAMLVGSSLGPAQTITATSGGGGPMPSFRAEAMMMADVPVESGQLAVSVSLQIRFALQD
ncbi:MAG: SIMPL domain-containing protein [Trueperaceae bacterium]|nr:SIMPL domain-containing protein [Trueperaceae bacterium]